MFLLLILFFLAISIVVRIVALPLLGYRRRGWYGYDPYSNPYRYGCRRHHRLLGGVLPIVALVALDRIFKRRSW